MRRSIVAGLAIAFSLVAGLGSAGAEVVLTDDSVFGPASVVRDIDNGHEFLRLDFTAPYTYNEVVSELGVGGVFEGWRVPSIADLDVLMASALIINYSYDPETVARAGQLRDWLGGVRVTDVGLSNRGLVSDFFYPVTYLNGARAQLAYSVSVRPTETGDYATFGTTGYGGLDHRVENIYLTRDVDLGETNNCNDNDPSTNPDADEVCDDGIDNNCDGLLDSEDPICPPVCLPTAASEVCGDGIDNNCDGLTDNQDYFCSCHPTATSEKGKTCKDGIDNDCDGLIDALDPNCMETTKGGRRNK